ncbi:MAG: hypothetical protein RLZZ80_1269, partial [Pseudomonadota bacterium]
AGEDTPSPSVQTMAYLLMGNLGGVLVGYLALRFGLLALRGRSAT